MDKEDLKKQISEIVTNDEESIKLLEIVDDGFQAQENNSKAFDELQKKYNDLQRKYKERFFDKPVTTSTNEPDYNNQDEEQKKYIDIKEI